MNSERPPVRAVAVFLAGLVSFLLVALWNEVRGFELWRNYALSGFLLGGPVVYTVWRHDVRIPSYIQAVIVGGLLLHYLGGSAGSPDGGEGVWGMSGINGAYHVFGWWDHLTHGVGIGATAMAFAYLLEGYQLRRGLGWNGPTLWTITVLAALTVGVGVELYEYLGKTAFQTIDQGGYVNTMQDLHYNLYGAAGGATLAVTVDRTAIRRRIEARWGGHIPPASRDGAWLRRQPSTLVGLVAFVTVPAAMALYQGLRYFFVTIPADDSVLYDPALNALTLSAVLAVAIHPAAMFSHRRWLQRPPQDLPAD